MSAVQSLILGLPPCLQGRASTLMDLWEDAVPWGQMALTALKAYQFYKAGVQVRCEGMRAAARDEGVTAAALGRWRRVKSGSA